MPEMAVMTMPTMLSRIMNFQQVFHHCSRLILETPRPATVMPAVGLMVLMVWLQLSSVSRLMQLTLLTSL